MTFRPRCPKCGHRPLSIERDNRARVDIVSCYICGWNVYGKANIEKMVREQLGSFKPAAPPKERTWSDSPLRAHEVRRARRAEKRGTPKGDEAVPEGWPTCSWKHCTNPTKKTKTGKPLKYCSRECSLKNAHQRHRDRKRNGNKGK